MPGRIASHDLLGTRTRPRPRYRTRATNAAMNAATTAATNAVARAATNVVTLALVAVLAVAVALGVAGCGPAAGMTAAGVVIAVDAHAGAVSGFTLRTQEGEVLSFRVGTLETDGAAFPAAHLTVHAVTLAPISVAYREEGSELVVYRMVDAPWAAPSG